LTFRNKSINALLLILPRLGAVPVMAFLSPTQCMPPRQPY